MGAIYLRTAIKFAGLQNPRLFEEVGNLTTFTDYFVKNLHFSVRKMGIVGE
ncbi:MAG: hypothetical protein KME21_10010 [Desmonostoc vinosum HA7617-LM4]|jgi:hypothetical protein|nr:hypothetical protein [Desmonostoc vinosum HA7617-LM4]